MSLRCRLLIISLAALALLPGWVSGERLNVILVTVDTLRADHLGAYGYSRDTSPNIDRMAREGVLFSNARVAIPKTTPSLVSIVTGLYPRSHRIFELRVKLDQSIRTLAQALGESGYHTIGVCGQFNCHGKLGFSRGFHVYDDEFQPRAEAADADGKAPAFDPHVERRAGELVDLAIGYIGERPKEKPVFLWLHLMDPHAGYAPPEPYDTYYRGRPPVPRGHWFGDELPVEKIHRKALVEGIRSFDFYVNRYDGEIRYMDAELGRFVDYLEREGLKDRSMLVFTTDHGSTWASTPTR